MWNIVNFFCSSSQTPAMKWWDRWLFTFQNMKTKAFSSRYFSEVLTHSCTLAFTEAHKFSIYSINYTCIHLHKQKLKKNPCHYFNTWTISESNSSKMCISGIKVYLLFLADRTAHRRAPSAESEMDAERWETSLEKDKAPLYTLPIVSGWNEMCVAENKWKLQRVNQSIHHDKLHLCSVVKHDNLFQSQISVITFYLSAFTKIKSWCAILPMPPNQLGLIY